MDEKRIAEIVQKVFEKAKKEHASHSRFALANHVSDQSDLSSKTLERAYDRYLEKNGKHGPPNAESIDLLCRYLEFENYADYIKKHPKPDLPKRPRKEGSLKSNWITISISIAFTLFIVIFVTQKWAISSPFNTVEKENCMTWADSLYVTVSCDIRPFSIYGTAVEPLDIGRLKNFKKKEVTAAFRFFSKNNQALIWYYKARDQQIEFYTAPGLHPVTGETLKKITPYIIQKYAPLHSTTMDSFVE